MKWKAVLSLAVVSVAGLLAAAPAAAACNMSEWSSTFYGTDSYWQKAGPVSGTWFGRRLPGSSRYYHDVFLQQAGGNVTQSLLLLAQRMVFCVQARNFTVTFNDAYDVWQGAVFQPAGDSSMSITTSASFSWSKAEAPIRFDGNSYWVRGGGEWGFYGYYRNNSGGTGFLGTIASHTDVDKRCTFDGGASSPTRSGTFNVASLAQGSRLQLVAQARIGEMYLHLGDCGGLGPATQSVFDNDLRHYNLFKRSGRIGGVYVNGTNLNGSWLDGGIIYVSRYSTGHYIDPSADAYVYLSPWYWGDGTSGGFTRVTSSPVDAYSLSNSWPGGANELQMVLVTTDNRTAYFTLRKY